MRLNVKKLFAVATGTVMAFAFSATAFAVGNPAVSAGSRYKIYPNGQTSHLLNVYGYGNENDNVTLYTPTNGNDQIWRLVRASANDNITYYYVVSALSNVQSLNYYHNSAANCQLHSYIGNTMNGKDDSAVYFSTGSRYIKLRDYARYLGFSNVDTNANVFWSTGQCAWGWATA